MTSVRLLQTCCISTSLNALFSRDSPLSIHKVAVSVVAAKRTTTHLTAAAAVPSSRLQHMEVTVPLQNSIDDAMLLPGTPSPVSRPRKGHERHTSVATRYADDSVPPSPSPSRPGGDFSEATRPTRSASTASRSTNRLSLTLPIAPPSAYPSRPTPGSTTTTSFPPTPLDTPSLLSPTDPSDFITAIAAQERRVLELGEDLRTAKHELDRLKRQFMNYEASRERQRERQSRRHVEPLRPIATALDHDPAAAATTRSAELDRRKALLLNQQTTQQQQLNSPTTENSRRRVFSGAHTRTLSLLSPTKPDSTSGFPILHEGDSVSDAFRQRFADYDTTTTSRPPITRGHVAKRASWAPRSTPLPPSGGVKQIAQDLKHGIWTFVEDLRQATVGDEPITGDRRRYPTNGDDTIRALPSSKPHVTSLFSDEPEPAAGYRTLTRSNTDVGAAAAAAKTKRFSWTPLTVDAYDDNDWSNWDSPGAASPAGAQRWSGTTVNGDIMPSVPPVGFGFVVLIRSRKASHQRSPLGSGDAAGGKFDELFPPVMNVVQNLMKGWERSLAPEERAASPGRLV
ncbi:hypothetical protein B0T18DRAFT_386414 [Schizothecium vesticola]|uniref:DUF4048 domain-containing protein n=1 Tax=Schizothecium vesticola TaxID=314040 RepID=A0AA40FB49_9PEZI|nr:hypothetical protein B0T18DRAFT_386414 [Schizothecium vesticola]